MLTCPIPLKAIHVLVPAFASRRFSSAAFPLPADPAQPRLRLLRAGAHRVAAARLTSLWAMERPWRLRRSRVTVIVSSAIRTWSVRAGSS